MLRLIINLIKNNHIVYIRLDFDSYCIIIQKLKSLYANNVFIPIYTVNACSRSHNSLKS